MTAMKRAVSLGARYGLRAVPMYADPEVLTPEIDESAMADGAVGIVITLAAVIIALYITAIVTGSISQTATSINMGSTVWENTITGLDSSAQSSFSLAAILPIAIVGVGILVIIITAFAMR
jgi:hypothetical protein